MTYRIELTRAARRDLARLPSEVLPRVDAHILALARDPFPAGAQKLHGPEGCYRVRVGDYRILYHVERQRLVILIIRAGHRRDVYRPR